jgi:hypothetical protein
MQNLPIAYLIHVMLTPFIDQIRLLLVICQICLNSLGRRQHKDRLHRGKKRLAAKRGGKT